MGWQPWRLGHAGSSAHILVNLHMSKHMIPRAIWVQASMLSHFPQAPKAIQWVGRTSTLDESMRELLLLLGYPPGIFSGFESAHCGATCASMVKRYQMEQSPAPPPAPSPASPPAVTFPPPAPPQKHHHSRHNAAEDRANSESRLEQGVLATDIEAETADSPLPFQRRLLANEKVTGDGKNTVSRLPWYDGPTAARVLQLFEIDVATYNSRAGPACMWD